MAWVPIDVAASTVLDMLRNEGDERVLHLTAPRPASWNDVFRPIADALGVPLVSSSEWLDRFRASARTEEEVVPKGESAHALLEFFESVCNGLVEEHGG